MIKVLKELGIETVIVGVRDGDWVEDHPYQDKRDERKSTVARIYGSVPAPSTSGAALFFWVPRYFVWIRSLVTGIQHFSWSSVRSAPLWFE